MRRSSSSGKRSTTWIAVLALLLLHPERKLHVREIARLTGTTAGTLNKELARLHEAELLERERVGNQLFYWANRAHPVYAELAGILAKTVGLADVLVEALAPLAAKVDVAFVFGSIARGTATHGSDVDILIVGDVDFGSVVDALHPVQQRIGREINSKVDATSEYSAKVAARDPFITEVLSQPRIFLIGNAHELGKLGRRGPRGRHAVQADRARKRQGAFSPAPSARSVMPGRRP
jgi:predicted nucleotidyltransferase